MADNYSSQAEENWTFLDDSAVRQWLSKEQPDVVVLAAATVGGIEANRSRPADFLLKTYELKLR